MAFRRWSAIFAVGAAAERRVWTRTGAVNRVYPNLFMFLVGPPGVGKTQAIVPAMEILRRSEATTLAPNDITKQSLLDTLAGAARAIANPPGMNISLYEYHYLTIAVRELSNFMSQYDNQLAGLLTDIFDNPPVNDEKKRTSKGSGLIVNPSLAMLAGTATKNLGKTIGSDLWGQGFMSRILLIYSAEQQYVDIFAHDETDASVAEYPRELVDGLVAMTDFKGPMSWDKPAQKVFTEWRKGGERPFPNHAKLAEYNARRWLHIVKLSMIMALSNHRMTIEADDFLLALHLLETAETAMPEIFKDMLTHNDGEVLRELHMFMWTLWMKGAQKVPVTAGQLTSFLMGKVASRDIARIIEVGETAGLYERYAGTSGPTAKYKPLSAVGVDLESLG